MLNKNQIKKEIRDLRGILPNEKFRQESRNNVLLYISSHPRASLIQKEERVSVFSIFSWAFFAKTGAIFGVGLLILGLSWKTIFAPISPAKNTVETEIASIKDEWKLADASPYLKDIFQDISAKDDSLSKSLSQDKTIVSAPKINLQRDNFKEKIISEAIELNNLGGPLAALKSNEADRLLENLVF